MGRLAFPRETYPMARARLLAVFAGAGYVTAPRLKEPYVKLGPNYQDAKLTFRPQAVYLNAHSLFFDIRQRTVEQLLIAVDAALHSGVDFGTQAKTTLAPMKQAPQTRGFTFINAEGHKILKLPSSSASFPSEAARQASYQKSADLARNMAGEEADDVRFRQGLRARDVGRSNLPGAHAKAEAERAARQASFSSSGKKTPASTRTVSMFDLGPSKPVQKPKKAKKEKTQLTLWEIEALRKMGIKT